MKPILKALLLADHVYEDRTTGKKIIAGTLDTVVVSEVDSLAYAYVSLTEIHGTARLRLKYTDLSDGEPLLEFGVDVPGDDPLAIIEVIIRMLLPTPHVGDYALELLSEQGNDVEVLGSHRVQVTEEER